MKIHTPLLAVLLCVHGVFAVAQDAAINLPANVPGHPRILLLNGEEKAVQKTIDADPAWQNVHRAILTECANIGKAAPLERIQTGRRLLSVSREALRRIFFLSYAWRMTKQPEYLRRAEQELLAVSAFSDWNPSHFLDVAEMTMAVGLGYDWLYDGLPESSRTAVREAILKKGLEPSLDAKNNSWLRASHNWNQVCNAGMTYGAMALYDEQPELARQIISRAVKTIELPMEDYKPDGAYPEGYGYWGYGTTLNVMFISAIEKLFGNDFGLTAKPGFLKTAGYLENMTGPMDMPFNYSDAGAGGELQPAMFWFASKAKDPSLLWVERDRLRKTDAGRHVKNRLLPAVMIWSAGVPMSAIREPKSLLWVGGGKSPVALMRSSWSDPSAIYVGLKAGSPSVNHAHMDVGSFVMDADGVRWAMDFGSQDYNSLETKGVKLWDMAQNSQRWAVFRYSNRVHNTLTVNDQLQNVKGYADITHSSASPSFLNATTDLSGLYNGQLASANRGVAIVDKQYVAVRDEVEAGPAETTLRWTMLTPAAVTVTGNKAELTKDGKRLILQVQEPANVTLKTWTTDPPHDYDTPNPGTTLVGFEVTVPANAKTALTVLLLPQRAGSVTPSVVQPLGQWPH